MLARTHALGFDATCNTPCTPYRFFKAHLLCTKPLVGRAWNVITCVHCRCPRVRGSHVVGLIGTHKNAKITDDKGRAQVHISRHSGAVWHTQVLILIASQLSSPLLIEITSQTYQSLPAAYTSAMGKVRHPCTQESKHASKLNQNETKRINLLWALTTERTRKQACTQAGVSLLAPSRIAKRYRETGSIEDRPHPGRKPIYTPEVLQRANEVAAALPPRLCTTARVLQALVQEQEVHEGGNTQAFRRAWKRHNRAQGVHMNTTDTSTAPFISKSDVNIRWRYAAHMLQLLNGPEAPDVNFIDETTVEEFPHPKSSTCPLRFLCAQHCLQLMPCDTTVLSMHALVTHL